MPDPVFVLGAPRSGTTLLRVMLAGHPQLWSPPEMVMAPFSTMAERKQKLTERYWEKGGLRRGLMDLFGVDVDAAKAMEASFDTWTVPAVYAHLQSRLGERLLVDKCPHLSAEPAALDRLGKTFPNAKWVWIVRHPGSVVRSIENMPMAEVLLQGYAADSRDIWFGANNVIRRFLDTIPENRRVTVRYEDLVTDAKPSLQRIADTLGVPFHDDMLNPYEGDRMRDGPPGARAVGDPNMAGRTKVDPSLADSWLASFDPASVSAETHTLARELGYDLGALAPPPIAATTAALDALLDAVRAQERSLRTPNDHEAAEARRFVLRLLGHGLDLFVENDDADHPRFEHAEGPTRKVFADNPDADYWRAPVRLGNGRRYRVTGRVAAGTTYIGMLLYRKGGRIGARLVDSQFVKPDGTFDVVVGAEDGCDLRGEGDETALFVRQYFHDRGQQHAVALKITPIWDAGPVRGLDPATLTQGLVRARRNLDVSMQRTLDAGKMAVGVALNRFVPIGGEALFPTPDNTYLVAWFRLGADQAAIVRGRLPKARYASLVVYDPWMQSIDDRLWISHLNDKELQTDADGRFELILSHKPVGNAKNRLDTGGHLAGYLLIRILLAEEPVEAPTFDVRWEREL